MKLPKWLKNIKSIIKNKSIQNFTQKKSAHTKKVWDKEKFINIHKISNDLKNVKHAKTNKKTKFPCVNQFA